MKLSFKASPNYRSSQSTSSIMRDLTLCLLAVTVFAAVWYFNAYGSAYGLRVIGLTCAAVVTALVVDALWFKAMKQDVKASILSNYSWVTALILVLISPVKTSYYAMIVCTAIAIIFGKMVFGGFGQNIFNPAAFGEALLMTNFASTQSADFVTSATPTVTANSYGWLMTAEDLGSLPTIGALFTGNYPSTIGSTCAILLILCFVFLVMRKDIDWQTSVVYVATIFVEGTLIGLTRGASASLGLIQVLTGGVLFGAVFMLTDPVTSPVTLPGRVVFAAGAASLTLLFRLRSNLADGVLFSILLMNALTPAIDKMFDGNQIRDAKKFAKKVWCTLVVLLALMFAIGFTCSHKEPAAASAGSSSSSSASSSSASEVLGDADYSSANPTATDNGDGTYSVSAKGFGGELTATIGVENGAITSYTDLSGSDNGDGIGDDFFTDGYLDKYQGVTLDSEVDSISGATFTSKAVNGMAQAALRAASGEDMSGAAASSSASAATLGTEDLSSANATATDNGDGTYAVTAKGFNGELTATIGVENGAITSFTDLAGGDDGDGIGDNYFADGGLDEFVGATLDSSIDGTSGATYTSTAVKAMAQAALKAAGGGDTGAATLGSEDLSSAKATATANGDGTYAVTAKGFNGELTATIGVENGAITSFTDLAGGDNGDGVGDNYFADGGLDEFIGATLDSSIDGTSGATYTSTAVKAMAQAALKAAAE